MTYDLVDYFFNADPKATNIIEIWSKDNNQKLGEQPFRAYRSSTTSFPNGFYIVKTFDRKGFEEHGYDDHSTYLIRDTTWQQENWCVASNGTQPRTSFELWDIQTETKGARGPRYVEDYNITGKTYSIPPHDIKARFFEGDQRCNLCRSKATAIGVLNAGTKVIHYDSFTFSRTGVILKDVLELSAANSNAPGGNDKFYYAKGYGWVGFEDEHLQSHYSRTETNELVIDDPCPGSDYGQVTSSGRDRVTHDVKGCLVVFARTTDNVLWYNWKTTPSSSWAGWNSLGGSIISNPKVVANADGRLEVFAVGTDKTIFHTWQTGTDITKWSGWYPLGTAPVEAGPCVARNADGRLEVFGVGADKTIYHIYQTAPNSGWSSWSSLGTGTLYIPHPSIAKNADGRLEVFGVGEDKTLYHIYQTKPNSSWSGWYPITDPKTGVLTTPPIVGINADGRLEIFAAGEDQTLYHTYQLAPNSSWSAWSRLGTGILNTAPMIGRNADGRLEIFAAGEDKTLYHIYQTNLTGGWSGWYPITDPKTGVLAANPGVGRNGDGRLEVFTLGADGAIYHIWQTAPNNGWSTLTRLDGKTFGSF